MTWTITQNACSSGAIVCVATDGVKSLALSEFGETTSTLDGNNWTRPTAQPARIRDLIWNGAQWLACNSDGAYTSPDAVTWTPHFVQIGDDALFRSCFRIGNTGYVSSDDRTMIFTGANPEPTVIRCGGPSRSASDGQGTVGTFRGSLIRGNLNGRFDGGRLQRFSPELNDILWTGTQYVAVGNDGAILTSGPPPKLRPSLTGNNISLTWPKFSRYDTYTIETSTDLLHWSKQLGSPQDRAETVLPRRGKIIL
jgi:hypothetical protein